MPCKVVLACRDLPEIVVSPQNGGGFRLKVEPVDLRKQRYHRNGYQDHRQKRQIDVYEALKIVLQDVELFLPERGSDAQITAQHEKRAYSKKSSAQHPKMIEQHRRAADHSKRIQPNISNVRLI